MRRPTLNRGVGVVELAPRYARQGAGQQWLDHDADTETTLRHDERRNPQWSVELHPQQQQEVRAGDGDEADGGWDLLEELGVH